MKGRLTTFTLLVASLSMPTALHAQSLADIAKKAQEQRDKAKAAAAEKAKTEGEQGKGGASTDKLNAAPTKVYTNKDLPGDSTRPAAIPVETKAEPAVDETSNKAATKKPDEPVKDEAYWRGRMTTLRDNLARDKAACEPLAEKVRVLDGIYADSVFYVDGKAMVNRASAAVIETKQADAKAELRQCTAKVALDQSTIATVEEEARRLGVLPGWLR
jgi:hypothetical protein